MSTELINKRTENSMVLKRTSDLFFITQQDLLMCSLTRCVCALGLTHKNLSDPVFCHSCDPEWK
jgi:hypothetical protein